MEPGLPAPLGATVVDGGVNFAVYSGVADRVELCLFDASGTETARMAMPACDKGTWHGFVAGTKVGQRYGYRVHGPYAPAEGLRCNPHKLLIDPYARALSGEFSWSAAVFDFSGNGPDGRMNALDSAPFIPKGVVCGATPAAADRAQIDWADRVIYEANVRGFTMRHPRVPDADRGRFSGMRNADVLQYLKALGITSVELMPVHEFIDEQFLVNRGLRNYWGYNTIQFFVPASRYAQDDPAGEFVSMVDTIHDAGLEVILDVAYNHTGESDRCGPTLSFRGLDNRAYYRLESDDPASYVDDTGCGNTVNFDSPVVRSLVQDSLRYWSKAMGVDGFRFDLAPVLGRSDDGFDAAHAMLESIRNDESLSSVSLIAEPWDPGPGGYQLGSFPPGWAEWNDRFRDSVRRFWRGDEDEAREFARRLHGSSDLFEAGNRLPFASVNFVTAHDGFTLTDLVTYEQRHNEANGEANRDGHEHNYSCNYGVEGHSDDAAISAIRARQRLNLLATVLLSQGTPMLLAGDEFGNSQSGNNNAYAQDNEIGWLDWSEFDRSKAFVDEVRQLIDLRRRHRVFREPLYRHGAPSAAPGWADVEWLDVTGNRIERADWSDIRAFTLLLSASEPPQEVVAILFNSSVEPARFRLPSRGAENSWQLAFHSAGETIQEEGADTFLLPDRSIALVSGIAD